MLTFFIGNGEVYVKYVNLLSGLLRPENAWKKVPKGSPKLLVVKNGEVHPMGSQSLKKVT